MTRADSERLMAIIDVRIATALFKVSAALYASGNIKGGDMVTEAADSFNEESNRHYKTASELGG